MRTRDQRSNQVAKGGMMVIRRYVIMECDICGEEEVLSGNETPRVWRRIQKKLHKTFGWFCRQGYKGYDHCPNCREDKE